MVVARSEVVVPPTRFILVTLTVSITVRIVAGIVTLGAAATVISTKLVTVGLDDPTMLRLQAEPMTLFEKVLRTEVMTN